MKIIKKNLLQNYHIIWVIRKLDAILTEAPKFEFNPDERQERSNAQNASQIHHLSKEQWTINYLEDFLENVEITKRALLKSLVFGLWLFSQKTTDLPSLHSV